MRTARLLAVTTAAFLVLAIAPAYADHSGHQISSPVPNPLSTFAQAEGDWTFLANFTLGPGVAQPLGVDVVPFDRHGRNYVLISSITLGFRVFDVTDPDAPTWVSDFGSSVGCSTSIAESQLDEPLDVLAAASGWENDAVVNQLDADGVIGEGTVLGDGTITAIGTDAGGRCHDGEHGGMELVDLSEPDEPELMWLTRQTGENHNTTYDPWNNVLLTSTSDQNAFIDILDLDSCRTVAQGGDGSCRIVETRYQFPAGLTTAEGDDTDFGCHDITVVEGRWLCAAVTGTVVLDSSTLRNARTGALTGSRLPCTTVPADQATAGGEMIVSDCRMSEQEFAVRGMRNVRVEPVAVIHHRQPSDPESGGYDVSHQAELVRGKDVLMVSDENGGGLTGGGCPGGGIGFFDIRKQTLNRAPKDDLGIPQAPFLALQDEQGRTVTDDRGNPRPAVFLIEHFPPGQEDNPSCTAHNFKQWGSQSRAFVGWYFGGGHAFDWDLDLRRSVPGVSFVDSAFEYLVGTPGEQWSWSTYAYRARENADGTTTYWVVNSDLQRGADFMTVTMPRP
ncbi:MAG: hypothetical protein GEU93_14810 [Propionibacteriales bacterium]|nr:hypothetical protein [Propionibacteriales bacterium]